MSCTCTVQQTADYLDLSWQSVRGLCDRGVLKRWPSGRIEFYTINRYKRRMGTGTDNANASNAVNKVYHGSIEKAAARAVPSVNDRLCESLDRMLRIATQRWAASR